MAREARNPLRGFGGAVQPECQNVCSITEYHRFFGSQGFGKLKFCYNARMSFDELDLTPSALETLRQEAAQRPDYIDLSSTNPTQHGFVFPQEILREAADVYWRARRYEPHPKGSLRAREAIAQYYARRDPPLEISPEQVFITASTREAYLLLFALLTQPGDNVLAPIPSYPLFSHLAAMHHIDLRQYMLEYTSVTHGSEAGGALAQVTPLLAAQWGLSGDVFMRQRNARTRAVMLISPHNPTGHVIRETVTELN